MNDILNLFGSSQVKENLIIMDRISTLKLFLILTVFTVFCSGCATILGGKNNTLVFKGDLQQNAKIYIDGNYVGVFAE